MEYFIRYTGNPVADLERGHSFIGYSLVSTKKAAIIQHAEMTNDMDEDFDLDAYTEENEDVVAQDNTTGLWGSVRSGLCGFGGFDTIEEAIEATDDPTCQYHATKYCAIFEGTKVYNQEIDGLDDGITFRPTSLVKVLTFDFNTQKYVENVE